MSKDPLLAEQVIPLIGVTMEPRRVLLEPDIALARARRKDSRAFAQLYGRDPAAGGLLSPSDWLNAWKHVCLRRFGVEPRTTTAVAPDGTPSELQVLMPEQEDVYLGLDVPTVLRLLKPGKMWCITFACVAQGHHPWGSNWEAYPEFACRGGYEDGDYTLARSDVAQLKRLWRLYRHGRHRDSQALSQALDRFNRSYSLRPIDVGERVTDLAMGLEALFVYEVDELGYRLGLRCACLLSPEPVERARICEEVRSGYRVRSHFVHGLSPPHSVSVLGSRLTLDQLAAALEHRLRTAIRLFIGLLDTFDEKTLKRRLLDEHILAGSASALAHTLSTPSAQWLSNPRPA